jgi:hypothetical protein
MGRGHYPSAEEYLNHAEELDIVVVKFSKRCWLKTRNE